MPRDPTSKENAKMKLTYEKPQIEIFVFETATQPQAADIYHASSWSEDNGLGGDVGSNPWD